jgi:glycosyltransferase involved in cell wall biosynthesis
MDGNFARNEGKILSPHMSYEQFGTRFTSYFEQVRLVARSFPSPKAVGGAVVGDRFSFVDLGDNRGASALVRKLPRLLGRLHNAIMAPGIVLIRFPGNIAILAMLLCILKRRKFSIEIVADAADYFSKDASHHPLRHIAKAVHIGATRAAAKRATTVRYVTTEYLQVRYPSHSNDRMFGFSDAYLPDTLFKIGDARTYEKSAKLKILNVGMMHNHSKGHLILLQSCAELRKQGIDIELTLIGGGRVEREVVREAERLGIADITSFRGVLPSAEVHSLLVENDVFVLPSLQEGLSRAMLEALAVGTPVIATNVGGTKEAISANSIIIAGDVAALTSRLRLFVQRREKEIELARIQQRCAQQYSFSSLQTKYNEYFSALTDIHASP